MPRFKVIELLTLKKKIVKVLATYGNANGGHLGYVTETIFYKLMPLFHKEARHS